ncbi:hypothetical protein D3C80_1832200 [compost metagenome]
MAQASAAFCLAVVQLLQAQQQRRVIGLASAVEHQPGASPLGAHQHAQPVDQVISGWLREGRYFTSMRHD